MSGKHFEEKEESKRKLWEKVPTTIQLEKEVSMTDVLGDAKAFSERILNT